MLVPKYCATGLLHPFGLDLKRQPLAPIRASGSGCPAEAPCVLYDRSSYFECLEIRGADRKSFLHGLCTGDIKGLAPGGSVEAVVPNALGRTLDLVSH